MTVAYGTARQLSCSTYLFLDVYGLAVITE